MTLTHRQTRHLTEQLETNKKIIFLLLLLRNSSVDVSLAEQKAKVSLLPKRSISPIVHWADVH